MRNRAIYILREKAETSYFTAHHGANALSPLLRLKQAQDIRVKLPEWKSIAHIFRHLGYDGKYQQERLMDTDMFFSPLTSAGVKACMKDYKEHSQFEMRFILHLDKNFIQMEYNPSCLWYRTMGVYSIDLDAGLENVQKLLVHAREHGINNFVRVLSIYNNSTGLTEKLNAARDSMRIEEYLHSPQAQENRERYWQMFGRQEDLDSKEMEEQ